MKTHARAALRCTNIVDICQICGHLSKSIQLAARTKTVTEYLKSRSHLRAFNAFQFNAQHGDSNK